LTAPVAATLPAAVEGQPLPTLAPMLERVMPAVVNIATVTRVRSRSNTLLDDPFFRRFFDLPERPRLRQAQSVGSGVIVDAARGYILTNNHVVDQADAITVTLADGRELAAELIGTDPDSDLAVIRIPSQGLTAVPLADSEELRVGDFVVAIGNPFGLGQTVTSGIVSALGRSGLGIEGYEDFIQTDASINPGNSGGALVNLRGELVGINTAIIAPGGGNVGIGFAIPVHMAREVMDQLVAHGEVRRGQLGISTQDLTPDLAQAFGIRPNGGAVIAQIAPGSPAERAGLRVGDVIVAVEGRAVRNSADVRNRVGLVRVGETVVLQILRDGRTESIRARMEEPRLEQLAGSELHLRLAGALLGEASRPHPAFGNRAGILVLEVERGSTAWNTGLRPGDRIVSANRVAVDSLETLRRALAGNRRGHLLLNIERGNTALFLLVQ
jgi:serine protease Do/serine protease DegQ